MPEIKVPDLGDGVIYATITMWHYSVGDSVKRDDDLVELVTDKATFNVPSPVSGRVTKVEVSEGETVKSGDLLAVIE
jgi:pyruvate/2-oxoglutarate dehydrogenase complex dihydrolipoamide acyltransferase (E2) component